MATNTPDVLTDTTADFGFALLMATARRITESEHWVRADLWDKWSIVNQTLFGMDLHHSTVGIIGMGRIGQGIAKRALGFGMNVIYHNRSHLSEADEKTVALNMFSRKSCCARQTMLSWYCPIALKVATQLALKKLPS